jgi:hypothetical protein
VTEETTFEDTPKVFKLITGEEIITVVAGTTDNYFMIEVPLEIRFNSIKQSLFLTRWKFGANYSKAMTLAGGAVVSVSEPEDIVIENYFSYRKQLAEELFAPEDTDEKTEDEEKRYTLDELFEELNSEETIH